MEPAFYRGDLLFLTNPSSEQYKTGDITVYKIPGADIPIVHRVMETHDIPNHIDTRQYSKSSTKSKPPVDPTLDNQLLLTKGDNNYVDDIELYQGLQWLEKKHIVGKVRGFLPYVGYVTIAMVSACMKRSICQSLTLFRRMISRNSSTRCLAG